MIIRVGLPLCGPGRNHKGARRNHVRFKAPVGTFRIDAHIPARGIGGHLIARIRLGGPGRVLIAHRIRYHVGDITVLFDRAHRQHIFGGARRIDRVAVSTGPGIIAAAIVARRKDEQYRLGTGQIRERIPRGRIIAGGRQIVSLIVIAPTVVGNQGVRQRRCRLKIRIRYKIVVITAHHTAVGNRPHARLVPAHPGDRVQSGHRRFAAKIRIRHRTARFIRSQSRTFRPIAGNDPGHVCAVAIGVHQTARRIAQHPGTAARSRRQTAPHGEIRMLRVNARVIHFHQHIRAVQVQIIGAHRRVKANPQRGTRQIVGFRATPGRFHNLYPGQLRQRHPVHRRFHPQDRTKR